MSFSNVSRTVSMFWVAVILSAFPVSCSSSCLDFVLLALCVDSVIDFGMGFIRWFLVVMPSVFIDLQHHMLLAPRAVSCIPLVLICCVFQITILPM